MATARPRRKTLDLPRFHATALPGAGARPISPFQDRTVLASGVLASVKAQARELGISRIGELTGLDTLGIPVAFATRPNSFSLSLSLGKGLEPELALTSAAMEAFELAVAERRPQSVFSATPSAMAASGIATLDLSRAARCQPHLIDPETPIDWIEGFDIVAGAPVYVPWSLVGLDHRVDPPGFHPAFEVATDGLASGSTIAEAALHAIHELIERDAYALLELLPQQQFLERAFFPVCATGSPLANVLRRIRADGHSITLVEMTSDIGIPAHLAILTAQSAERQAELGAGVDFIGCGCHVDPIRSMMRAVTEAAQARAAYIAGARDDFQSAWRGDGQTAAKLSRNEATPPERQIDSKANNERPAPATIGDRITTLLSALHGAGMDSVVVVDLQPQHRNLSVVRVLIPDLQVPLHGQRSQVTARGLKQILRAMA